MTTALSCLGLGIVFAFLVTPWLVWGLSALRRRIAARSAPAERETPVRVADA